MTKDKKEFFIQLSKNQENELCDFFNPNHSKQRTKENYYWDYLFKDRPNDERNLAFRGVPLCTTRGNKYCYKFWHKNFVDYFVSLISFEHYHKLENSRNENSLEVRNSDEKSIERQPSSKDESSDEKLIDNQTDFHGDRSHKKSIQSHSDLEDGNTDEKLIDNQTDFNGDRSHKKSIQSHSDLEDGNTDEKLIDNQTDSILSRKKLKYIVYTIFGLITTFLILYNLIFSKNKKAKNNNKDQNKILKVKKYIFILLSRIRFWFNLNL